MLMIIYTYIYIYITIINYGLVVDYWLVFSSLTRKLLWYSRGSAVLEVHRKKEGVIGSARLKLSQMHLVADLFIRLFCSSDNRTVESDADWLLAASVVY